MSTIIIQKKATALVCHRCSWKWNYTGKNPYVATCPFCRTNISIRKYKRLLQQTKKQDEPQQIQQKGARDSTSESVEAVSNQTIVEVDSTYE
jgi:ribosomal protein L37E